MKFLATFLSSQHAIAIGKKMPADIPFLIIPTPREIQSSCGIAMLLSVDHSAALKKAIAKMKLSDDLFKLYRCEEIDGRMFYFIESIENI